MIHKKLVSSPFRGGTLLLKWRAWQCSRTAFSWDKFCPPISSRQSRCNHRAKKKYTSSYSPHQTWTTGKKLALWIRIRSGFDAPYPHWGMCIWPKMISSSVVRSSGYQPLLTHWNQKSVIWSNVKLRRKKI